MTTKRTGQGRVWVAAYRKIGRLPVKTGVPVFQGSGSGCNLFLLTQVKNAKTLRPRRSRRGRGRDHLVKEKPDGWGTRANKPNTATPLLIFHQAQLRDADEYVPKHHLAANGGPPISNTPRTHRYFVIMPACHGYASTGAFTVTDSFLSSQQRGALPSLQLRWLSRPFPTSRDALKAQVRKFLGTVPHLL